ncbi:hypothetical protein [Paenibacillus sp. MMO-177]|uniref:hypothetical protein n=1 Tax=Paenibacillus sp. MMO-177 TaxID=3081289 RepID=UPI0030190C45
MFTRLKGVVHHLLATESFGDVVLRAANKGSDLDIWGSDWISIRRTVLRQEPIKLGDALLALRESERL